MARPTMPTCLAVVIAAMAAIPSTSSAGHQYTDRLAAHTYGLRCAAERFEQAACRRQLPRHDLHLIRLLTKRVCRLDDEVRANAHPVRVRAIVRGVSGFMRTIDHRMCRSCRRDPLLLHKWEAVQHQMLAVRRAVDSCFRGSPVPYGKPSPYGNQVPHVERLDPPPIPGPPVQDSRFIDPRYQGPDFNRYNRPHQFDDRFARSSAPPWLDALRAILSR